MGVVANGRGLGQMVRKRTWVGRIERERTLIPEDVTTRVGRTKDVVVLLDI
jgi:hypothetical protein